MDVETQKDKASNSDEASSAATVTNGERRPSIDEATKPPSTPLPTIVEGSGTSTGANSDTKDQLEADKSGEVPWSIWTPRQKKLIILSAALAALFSPLSGQIYFPALDTISRDLHVSNSLINLTVTTYMIFQGLAPAFIGGLSDASGRRPAYMACFIIYLAANIGLALQNNYAALMVLRCIQSAGSSATVALASAVVADMVTSAERGVYISWTSVPIYAGPAVGPVIGGVLAQFAGWHFIFWFLAILAGVVFTPMLIFFPETCRRIVGDGSIPARGLNKSVTSVIMERRARAAGTLPPPDSVPTVKRPIRFPNPLGVLQILRRPECGLPLLFNALMLSGTYAALAAIPAQFSRVYHYNQLQIALCYIPIGCGSIAAAFVRGRFIDARFRHHAKRLGVPVVRNRRVDLTDFPIERARIEVALPTIFLGCAFYIAFGWTVDRGVNVAAPLIFSLFIGFCISASLNCIAVLVVDLNPDRAGTASAANNLVRCWFGAASTAVIQPLIEAIGIGWTNTLFAGLVLACSPMLWYIMKKGPEWRKASKARMEKTRREKEAKANVAGEKGVADRQPT